MSLVATFPKNKDITSNRKVASDDFPIGICDFLGEVILYIESLPFLEGSIQYQNMWENQTPPDSNVWFDLQKAPLFCWKQSM